MLSLTMIDSRDITYNLHKVTFLMDKIGGAILEKELGLTLSQFRILMAIDKGEVCQSHIAKFWEMTEAAISRQIDILLERDLIKSEENEENRRKNNLELTKLGKNILKKSFQALDKTYEAFYSQLDQNDRERLMNDLKKILSEVCKGKGDL